MGETGGWDASWAVQPVLPFDTPQLQEKNGAIYTKPWVVELMLDLAGYTPSANLVDACAVEPAAGDGAFLVPMARRLVATCRRQQRPIRDCCPSLLGCELEEASAAQARASLTTCLLAEGILGADVAALVHCWVRTANYLLDAPRIPPADFVIGNPPYIRLEDMDDTLAAIYRAAYRTMVGRADLYIAFFEAALRQLKAGGVCAFICADRWMLNQYGAELRRFITASFAVETVVEMHNAAAFADEVSAYPAIVVTQ
jgi:type I restriction-modification system DNA methylase subunit